MGNKKAKKKNAKASGGFVVAAIAAILIVGGGKGCQPDPEVHRVPPSTPTDVGTLPPGLDK